MCSFFLKSGRHVNEIVMSARGISQILSMSDISATRWLSYRHVLHTQYEYGNIPQRTVAVRARQATAQRIYKHVSPSAIGDIYRSPYIPTGDCCSRNTERATLRLLQGIQLAYFTTVTTRCRPNNNYRLTGMARITINHETTTLWYGNKYVVIDIG